MNTSVSDKSTGNYNNTDAASVRGENFQGCRKYIDTAALIHNYRLLCDDVNSVSPGTVCASVVKADAYGHGIDICVPALYSAGCRFFIVATLGEALRVKAALPAEATDTEILILEYTSPERAAVLSENGFIQSVFSEDYVRALNRYSSGGRIRVHIKIDTGMNRLGFSCGSEEHIAALFEECTGLEVCGIFSHIFEPSDASRLLAQYESFTGLCDRLERLGFDTGMRHICASDGIFTVISEHERRKAPRKASGSDDLHNTGIGGKKPLLDAVRLGTALYGYSGADTERFPSLKDLIPVMTFFGTVEAVHIAASGNTVGYGGDYLAVGDRRIATVCGGYDDGVLRVYSGEYVRVITDSGIYAAPICGRVCMDAFMIDVTELPPEVSVSVGDRVIIFGSDGGESLRRLAKKAGTIVYECLTSTRDDRWK
ncbi:MAG: alanine racemase [Clostridia bacterium]|nr:alanine racemase [Clostridia bacterium]MDY3785775.1 alanine racemase [Eubacteriales bacterium]